MNWRSLSNCVDDHCEYPETKLDRLKKEIESKDKEIKILREALVDFKDHGTRHDVNPTGQFMECGCFQSMSNDSWQGYIKSQDKWTRERARQALAEIDKMKGV